MQVLAWSVHGTMTVHALAKLQEIKFLQVVSDDPNVNKLSRLIIDESPGRRADYKKIATAIESDYAL